MLVILRGLRVKLINTKSAESISPTVFRADGVSVFLKFFFWRVSKVHLTKARSLEEETQNLPEQYALASSAGRDGCTDRRPYNPRAI